jgi:hypothetical protein
LIKIDAHIGTQKMKVTIEGNTIDISDQLYKQSKTLLAVVAECIPCYAIPLDGSGFSARIVQLISNIAEEHKTSYYPGRGSPVLTESRSHNPMAGWEVKLLKYDLNDIKELDRLAKYLDNDELIMLFSLHQANLIEFLTDTQIQFLFDAKPLTEEQKQEAQRLNDMWIGLPAPDDYSRIIKAEKITWLSDCSNQQ